MLVAQALPMSSRSRSSCVICPTFRRSSSFEVATSRLRIRADTIVEVTSLYSPEALIEIEAIAVADEAVERI